MNRPALLSRWPSTVLISSKVFASFPSFIDEKSWWSRPDVPEMRMRIWKRVKLISNRFRKRGQESRKLAPVTERGSKKQQQQPRREQARGEVRIHPPGSGRIGTVR